MTRGEVTGCPDLEALLQEHRALLTASGAVQRRCNALLDAQALQVQSLTAQVVRLRAALVVRDTARALSIANKHWHKDTMPAVLCVGTQGPHAAVAQRVVEMVGGHFLHHDGLADGDGHGVEALEASLVAADLVMCAPVIEREARELAKPLTDHYAHLLVHGTLHAQGWDHETSTAEAEAMEARETAILGALGLADPYK